MNNQGRWGTRTRRKRRGRHVSEEDGVESGKRRRSRRCRVGIEQFRLFDRDGRCLDDRNMEALQIARSNTGLTAEAKFGK